MNRWDVQWWEAATPLAMVLLTQPLAAVFGARARRNRAVLRRRRRAERLIVRRQRAWTVTR